MGFKRLTVTSEDSIVLSRRGIPAHSTEIRYSEKIEETLTKIIETLNCWLERLNGKKATER
jgi:hypothetical protein